MSRKPPVWRPLPDALAIMRAAVGDKPHATATLADPDVLTGAIESGLVGIGRLADLGQIRGCLGV